MKSIHNIFLKHHMHFRVGIPRGLTYFIFGTWWSDFFQRLGVEVVVSPPTNKQIQELAVLHAPDEDCYSVKLFYGHVLILRDKVDFLFIPRFGSDHPVHVGCPKVLALPEILKSMHPNLPQILMPYFSRSKAHHGRFRLIQLALEVGHHFTGNPVRILHALSSSYRHFRQQCAHRWLTPTALQAWEQAPTASDPSPRQLPHGIPLKVALCAHPYVLNDDLANIQVRKKLTELGFAIVTSEQFPRALITTQMAQLDYNLYFEYEREILGTIMHYLTHPGVDGIIQISVFSCGPDSIGGEIAARWARRHPTTPLLQLVFDEHTGEAGLTTRLEAFADLITRRKSTCP